MLRHLGPGHLYMPRTVAFSPDGHTVASACEEGKVRIWSTYTGELLNSFYPYDGLYVQSLAFSPDGGTVACGATNAETNEPVVSVWATHPGAVLRSRRWHTDPVAAVAFAPDGRVGASGSIYGTVCLWSPFTGEVLQTIVVSKYDAFDSWRMRPTSLVFSPDGGVIAVASFGEEPVQLYSAATGALVRSLTANIITDAFAFFPDGGTVVGVSSDFKACLWATATGEVLRTLEFDAGAAGGRASCGAAVAPDGGAVAFVAGAVCLGSTATGQIVRTLDVGGGVTNLAFSRDAQTLACGMECGQVRLWSAATGALLRTLDGFVEEAPLVFSPDGRSIAAASETTVRLWSCSTAEVLKEMEGHRYSVLAVAFAPDGATLASGSDDTEVRLWSTSTGWTARVLREMSGRKLQISAVGTKVSGSTAMSGTLRNILTHYGAPGAEDGG